MLQSPDALVVHVFNVLVSAIGSNSAVSGSASM